MGEPRRLQLHLQGEKRQKEKAPLKRRRRKRQRTTMMTLTYSAMMTMRKDMLARLKKEAEERTAKKEAKQRTLVAIEVKPWSTEQDLMALFKKIQTEITSEGLKWAVNCNLVDVAFGIKKIVTTFTMGANNSSDDVIEAIEAFEDDVQSVEVISMTVL